MKIFIPILLSILLYSGCAQRNAFDDFALSQTREKSEDVIQTVKIKKADRVDGILTVVYLNKVLPKLYKNNEYFYVYYYLKDNNETLDFSLNNNPSMLREKLDSDNDFSYLTLFDAKWSRYNLIGFKKEGNVLNLKVKTSKGATASLQFIKDKI